MKLYKFNKNRYLIKFTFFRVRFIHVMSSIYCVLLAKLNPNKECSISSFLSIWIVKFFRNEILEVDPIIFKMSYGDSQIEFVLRYYQYQYYWL